MQLSEADEPSTEKSELSSPEKEKENGEQAPAPGGKSRADGETEELLDGVTDTDADTDKAAESGEKKPSEFKQGHPYALRA